MGVGFGGGGLIEMYVRWFVSALCLRFFQGVCLNVCLAPSLCPVCIVYVLSLIWRLWSGINGFFCAAFYVGILYMNGLVGVGVVVVQFERHQAGETRNILFILRKTRTLWGAGNGRRCHTQKKQ